MLLVVESGGWVFVGVEIGELVPLGETDFGIGAPFAGIGQQAAAPGPQDPFTLDGGFEQLGGAGTIAWMQA